MGKTLQKQSKIISNPKGYMISLLKKKYGYKCTGIKLNYNGTCVNTPSTKMRFCEAVNHSFNVPLLLKTSSLSCKGSQRSMGLLKSNCELITHLANESNMSKPMVSSALADILAFPEPIENVYLGIQPEMEEMIRPDLFILQIKPRETMDLIRLYSAKTNSFPIIKPYTFLSVCGNVLVGSLQQKQMSISFGCPESRRYGGIDDENVIVGIPYDLCNLLFK